VVPLSEIQHDLVEHLRRPAAYPWQPTAVELIETHISWVFLAGDRVVKIKRPVAYDFVDHTTLAARHQSCVDEVHLNRRLTSGVYLDVVPIVHDGMRYRVDGTGTPVEWATLMRRLPAERMLDALIEAGTAPANLADLLARPLIPFHRDAAPCGSTPGGSAANLAAVLLDNLDELQPFTGSLLAPQQFAVVDASMRAFLHQQRPLLEQRVVDGWVREGHGDLRAEHICLESDGQMQIFDCIEFNEALRCADVVSDIAFLLMDLTRLGAGAVAAALTERYREAGIELPPPLLNLYRAHRALVRAKVECLSPASSGADAARLDQVATYLNLATRATITTNPALIVMTGLSGTGKSTVARTLSQALGLPTIASDVIRKRLAGVQGPTPTARLPEVYNQEMTDATYAELLDRAATMLAGGSAVIADATFLESDRRMQAAAIAAQARAPMVIVETVCDEATVAARLQARQQRGADPSDADLTIYRRQRAQRAHPASIPAGTSLISVDTTGFRPDMLDPVFAALAQQGMIEARIPDHDAPFAYDGLIARRRP
jgi:aminoglycoside phosphotransferase family enzyme/predicted kinase